MSSAAAAATGVAGAGAGAASAAVSPSSSASVPPNLVQADSYDFIPGNSLWIRGQEAILARFDYPHVYWQWKSELQRAAAEDNFDAQEKHRSCSVSAALFHVPAESKRTAASAAAERGQGGDGADHLADTSDEDEDMIAHHNAEGGYGHNNQQQQQQQQHGSAGDNSSSNDSSSEHTGAPGGAAISPSSAASGENAASAAAPGARASLMSMFSRRPEKAIISLVDAPEETIHAAAPQSVSIESSARTRFIVPNKISQLTILNCEDVEVEFRAVISTVELIRCKRCTIRCIGAAPTWTVDDSDGCTLAFPGRQGRVMVVSTDSARTVCVATTGGIAPALAADGSEEKDSEGGGVELDSEVRFIIEEPQAVGAADGEGAGAALAITTAPTPSEPVAAGAEAKEGEAAGDGDASSPSAATASAAKKQLRTLWQQGSFSTQTLSREGPLGYFNNK